MFVIVEAAEKKSPAIAVQGSAVIQQRLLSLGIDAIKMRATRQLSIDPEKLDAEALVKQIATTFSQ